MRRDKPEISGNDVADEIADARHAAREAVVRRACDVMGWEYKTSPAYAGIRQVALGNAVAISVEKLHELLDRISPRPGLCEHGIKEGDWCEPCNKAMKQARIDNGETAPAECVECGALGPLVNSNAEHPGWLCPSGRTQLHPEV